LEEIPYFKNP